METTPRFRRIIAISILALLVLWVAAALWLVPWLIAKAWAGEAGGLLNSLITGQAETSLESYHAIWRRLALRLTAVLLVSISVGLGVLANRERIAAVLRRPVDGLPAAGGIGVVIFAAWTGVWFGVAEATAYTIRSVVLNAPIGGVPWQNAFWMAPLAATATLSVVALAAIALERLLRAGGAVHGTIAPVLIGIGSYSLIRSMALGLAPIAVGILALGLGVTWARIMAGRPRFARRFIRRTLPVAIPVIAAIAFVVPLRQRLSERDSLARLPTARSGAPSVLLIVWDGVRARNLSVYGSRRRTSPVLEELAARGAVFDQAVSTAPWSLPSHASLFTGRHAFELSTGWTEPLDDTYPTLSEVLSEAGYAAGGFIGNLYFGKRGFGLERGFAWYDDLSPYNLPVIARTWWLSQRIVGFVLTRVGDRREVTRRSAAAVNRSFLDWQARQGDRPFFAFINYIDTHEPYRPPDPFQFSFGEKAPQYWYEGSYVSYSADVLRQLEEAYDGTIRYVDHQFGRLLGELERRGLSDNLIVIVTSDHGEEFGERHPSLIGHGRSLYYSSLHVPLVIEGPGVPAGARVERTVSIRDIPATVMDLVGLEGPFPGESLVPSFSGATEGPGEPRLAQVQRKEEYARFPQFPAGVGDMHSLVRDNLHYIVDGRGDEHLYDIRADPDEANDLAASPAHAERLRWFRQRLGSILESAGSPVRSR